MRKSRPKTNYSVYRKTHNLKPLLDYMQRNHINVPMLAILIGRERQTINNMFRNDEASLAKLEEIANALNCELVLQLSRYDTPIVFSNEKYTNFQVFRPSDRLPRRLKFLYDAMAYCRLNSKGVADGMRKSLNAVNTWFITDNIKVSHVYKFARTFGFTFHMEFVPRKKHEPSDMEDVINFLRLYNNPRFHSVIDLIIKGDKLHESSTSS